MIGQEVSYDAYVKAKLIVEQYKRQTQKVQVSVTYNAEIRATLRMDKTLTTDEIKDILANGCYGYGDEGSSGETRILQMTSLIVNGEQVINKSNKQNQNAE